MSGTAQIWDSRSAVRNVLFVGIAIVLFLLKGQYSGPYTRTPETSLSRSLSILCF